LFQIWVIGIYLKFDAWDLVLPYGYAPSEGAKILILSLSSKIDWAV
jgi:hypothetical protein